MCINSVIPSFISVVICHAIELVYAISDMKLEWLPVDELQLCWFNMCISSRLADSWQAAARQQPDLRWPNLVS